MRISSSIVLLMSATCLATTAHAWDPNAGAEDARPAVARYQPAPHASVVPKPPIVVTPIAAPAPAPVAYVAPQPAVIAPLPVATPPAPVAYVAPQPVAAAVPAEQYYQQQPAYVAPAAPVGRTAYIAPYEGTPQQEAAYRKNRFSLGLEGFWDQYKENSVNLTDNGDFGGVTAAYTHYFNPAWYATLDLSAAIGSTDYKSNSGTIDNITQWQTENRLLGGYDYANYGPGRHVRSYIGLGMRYFSDELKGKVASGGASGYDRRITQFYLPIGVTYEFPAYGLNFAPNIEVDPLIYGNVSSRLGTIPGFLNEENQQNAGFGIRSELMMGHVNDAGMGWQFGPFVRYWHIPDSKSTTDSTGTWVEPQNTRLQLGAKLKAMF